MEFIARGVDGVATYEEDYKFMRYLIRKDINSTDNLWRTIWPCEGQTSMIVTTSVISSIDDISQTPLARMM